MSYSIQVAELVVGQNSFNWMSFFSTLAAAFFGAVSAFFFNSKLQQRQEKQKNILYLNYTISILAELLNNFYTVKKQIILPRQEELIFLSVIVEAWHLSKNNIEMIEKIEKDFPGKVILSEHGVDLKDTLLQITLTFQEADRFFPVELEKLNFLSKSNPQIILMLSAFKQKLATYDNIKNYLNNLIAENKSTAIRSNILFFEKLTSSTKNLSETVDDCWYFSEKLINLLVEFGKREYKKYFNISYSYSLPPEESKLKPKPIKFWEKSTQWPKKKTIKEKLINKINIVFKRGDNK